MLLPEEARVEAMIPPCKRRDQATLLHPKLTTIHDELGEYISRDAQLVSDLGWEFFIKNRRGRGDFSDLGGVDEPTLGLLSQYRHRVTPVVLSGHKWTEGQQIEDLYRVPHQSTMKHVSLFHQEFASMVIKGWWVVLPYSVSRSYHG